MANCGDALDDAIAHLDALISRLTKQNHPPTLRTHNHKQEGASQNKVVNDVSKKAVNKHESKSVSTPSATVSASTEVSSGIELELLEDFNKAHLQVGCVLSVDDHPVADKLYVCKVEVAKGEARQVVAGLRKFLPSSELLGKKVCLLLNLKPAKLAGQLSEAMILAGEASLTSGSLDVQILQPPPDAFVGDRIYLEDTVPSSKPAKQLSSKVWEKLVSLLGVEGGVAKFNKRCLVTSSGLVVAPGLPNGAGIH